MERGKKYESCRVLRVIFESPLWFSLVPILLGTTFIFLPLFLQGHSKSSLHPPLKPMSKNTTHLPPQRFLHLRRNNKNNSRQSINTITLIHRLQCLCSNIPKRLIRPVFPGIQKRTKDQ